MAKRKAANTTLNSAATSIGEILGGLSARVHSWNEERHRLLEEVQHVTSSMLSQLGHAGSHVPVVKPVVSTTASSTGRRPGFTMSAEARARISAAQKARWAKTKGGEAVAESAPAAIATGTKKKKRTVSPEVREKLARLAKARWAKAKKAGKSRLG